MRIRPAKCLRGEIKLPGDKSISHRAAMIAAMAEGETRIENFATSADCASTLHCLQQLGVGIRREGNIVWITGVGRVGFSQPTRPLDCGNSGTSMRLLAGILAGQDFESVLIGDASLMGRPMRRIADPLTQMGAGVETTEGRAPITLRGKFPLDPIEYVSPVASAQIKSCVLLAGLNASGETTYVEPVETRDHTERMLGWFGVNVRRTFNKTGFRISVSGGEEWPSPGVYLVPADISAAAFFVVGAACLKESVIRMHNVGANPTRATIVGITAALGGQVQLTDQKEAGEPVATITARGGLRRQKTNKIGGDLVALLIDELPILAVMGSQIESGLEVRNAGELRVKETDRIAAVVENLRRMGAEVEEFEDGFRVHRSRLKGARVDSFGDHRIAMAFAIAGLLAEEGETEIVGAECVDVSFPGFFDVLEDVVVYE